MVTPEASAQTELAVGTPVTAGTADASGVGVFNLGDMLVMFGSSVYMIHVVPKLTVDRRYGAGPYLFKDAFLDEILRISPILHLFAHPPHANARITSVLGCDAGVSFCINGLVHQIIQRIFFIDQMIQCISGIVFLEQICNVVVWQFGQA